MSACPACGQDFVGGERFCPTDGAKLPSADDTPTAREQDPLIGKLLDGRYRVEAKLGEGGMGAVYRVVHVHMDKPFALKVLRPHLSADAVAVKRFQREAKSASLLDHEHCIRVTDFGYTQEGLLFLAMEHLEGRTLGAEIHDTGALAPRRVASIATQICQALAHAHDHGLVHRDLKPDNVFLLHRDGNPDFVKVLDFGLAKLLEKEISETGPHKTSLTEHGIVFGTPEYMSPEQAQGRPIDLQTDIYSLGICMYHMLTGLLPFQAPTYMSILTKHLLEPPVSPLERRPDLALPASFVEVLMQCLEKDPAARPDGARAVVERIASCDLGPASVPARVPAAIASHPTVDVALPASGIRPLASELEPSQMELEPARRRRGTWVLIPLSVLAIAGFAAVLVFTKENAPEKTAKPAEMLAVPAAAEDAGPTAQGMTVDAGIAHAALDAPPVRPTAEKDKRSPAREAAEHLAKAAAFKKKGDEIQERVYLQKALEAEPDNVQARLLLGEAALADGNKELGCKHLKRAMRLGSNRAKPLYEKAECDLVGP